MIKLLIIDIDGILNSGKQYSSDGKINKTFKDIDFTAIKRFKAAGVKVIFLSGDKNINENMAKERKIPFYYARLNNGNLAKEIIIDDICKEYNINLKDIAYIADDYFDIPLLKKVGISFCPVDAISSVKYVSFALSTRGGDGVIADLYERCIEQCLINPASYEKVLELDAKEYNER